MRLTIFMSIFVYTAASSSIIGSPNQDISPQNSSTNPDSKFIDWPQLLFPWLWPNQQVPYEIDSSLVDIGATQLILNSFELIHQSTCIRFIEKTSNHSTWVKFILNDNVGCLSSKVGRHFSSAFGQKVELSSSCLSIANVQRGLGLVLGLDYEDTRPDRDQYILFHEDRDDCAGGPLNISSRHSESGLNVRFDYASHMFSQKRECFSPVVGGAKLGSSNSIDGGKLSPLDLEKLNAIYNCDGCNSYRFLNVKSIKSSAFPLDTFNPVYTGADHDGILVFICRVYHLDGSLLIGKAKITGNENSCWVALDGKEFEYKEGFDVMTNVGNYTYKWVANTRVVPELGMIGGKMSDRIPLYIGKCTLTLGSGASTTVAGSYNADLGTLSVGFDSKGYNCYSFELATC